MTQRILVTGSAGLIGRTVTRLLRAAGTDVAELDLRGESQQSRGDVCDPDRLASAMRGAAGIIHLAAVSRVIDGERDPARCWRVNAEASGALLQAAIRAAGRPWVIYASSREVYGQQDHLPVAEDAPLRPKNIYARAKAEAERLAGEARAAGLRTAILRFSNVYGDTRDHVDRVVPAFARAAALARRGGGEVRVDGKDCTFDFTHVADVADGIVRVAGLLRDGEAALPAIHLVGGHQTSLGRLAALARAIGGPALRVVEAPPRGFDVHRFAGDPARAERLLGWRATTALAAGFETLANAYLRELAAAE
ncbi:MAG TPA: NAD(P)-dependent oxidoreductase [Dongiaceae bacterium]|jgi:nucleoside-diphosphate-sugar epimerase|nr:NAD(P)-dependent oxidoreductase [Dongiaceae bacterium]